MFTGNNLLGKILSKNIDKAEAIRMFERLPESEKRQLVSDVRSKVLGNGSSHDTKSFPGERLKAVSERQLNEQHKIFISGLAQRLEKLAPTSKENASRHQAYFVDQRKTGGLKKSIKALQFNLTYEKGEGPYLYDVDGNKYIDIAGDNGVNLFGHQPEFVKEAIVRRLNEGYPLVGYTNELFEVAKLFSELTGHERVLMTQSGTEAVMWAVRIARAATSRKKIVIFDGAFHGLSDAVLAAKDQFGNSIAMGLGMLQEFADQLIVLDYGKLDHLDIIEERWDEIAGVLVEPVQSRHPLNQPIEFLKELRKLTLEKGIVLIMDEMITGFRVSCKGVQGEWGIKGDIATYGKIPAGGMPSGMIAGSAKYMNLVDGGAFSYYDDSMPSIKKSLMAGTHTRNPIKLAASLATLKEIKNRCTGSGKEKCDSSCFLKRMGERTRLMCEELNSFFTEKRVPIVIEHFSSLFRFRFLDDEYGVARELMLVLMRINGVESSPSGNCFLTTTHSDEDIKAVINAVKESTNTLLLENFFHEANGADREITPPEATVAYKTANVPDLNKEIDRSEILRKLLAADLKQFQQKLV